MKLLEPVPMKVDLVSVRGRVIVSVISVANSIKELLAGVEGPAEDDSEVETKGVGCVEKTRGETLAVKVDRPHEFTYQKIHHWKRG